jgi:Na+-translocating ferredoxin:NAD+ oxidoreductase subunit G
MSNDVQVEAPQAPPDATPTFAMLRTLGGISLISGLLVVLAYQFTQPIIAENQRVRTEQAVFRVIPGAVSKHDFVVVDGGLVPAGPGVVGELVYAGYDADNQLKGIAITGVGGGYAGPVKVLFNYDPACQCIIGSKILQSTETPGFGDKMETDPEFLENLKALDARLTADGTALANPIVTVKHGTKTHPWQIDAITGATISSKAMGKAANAAAQRAAPAIQRDLAKLAAAVHYGKD